MSVPPDRYHALDSLRGFAMFLGIVLHAAISFMTVPPPFWPVRDRSPDPLADLMLFAIHDFRMQLFFLLAGFFGCLLYLRYGARGAAWHRVKRVAVPFVLAVVFVVPTVMAAVLYAELENARAEGAPAGASPVRAYAAELVAARPDEGSAAIVLGQLTSGRAAALVPLVHLWFLYFLLFFYAAALLAAPLLARLSGTRFLAALDGAFRRVVAGRLRVAAPALCTLPVLLTMKLPAVDTQLSWVPERHLLLYYGGFFAFGWMLYRHRDLVPAFGRRWGACLVVANAVVLPVMLAALLGGIGAVRTGGDVFPWWLGGFAAQAVYTWLMIVGLWGAFLRLFARRSAWARYLADASYWCYLASITPTVLFQFVVKDWPLPGLVKWVLVTVAVMAVLLASYEWCVRYTLIGAILNGRKYRCRAEGRAAEPVPAARGRGELCEPLAAEPGEG
ncbi:MAG: acyltransferase family protein [Planctomycetes bacterium]|nr:acyltransferase family protein [Planctomycetota bacterium]